jgi:meckelin
MPPTDLSDLEGSPFFYRDPGMGFERVFFSGKEFDVLLLEMTLFALLFITIDNIFVAALVVWVVSKTLRWVRGHLGERNIARKTLIDKRFLI